jgi:hypothetical protein
MVNFENKKLFFAIDLLHRMIQIFLREKKI